MIVLSEEQVSFILDDIKRNGIELEELQLNLLDHICCIIENEMKPGQDFYEFYRKIIPRFFKRELGEIQEETDLLLTFKHYYTMKKVMLYSGTFAAILVVAGSIFKAMHWPGASPLFLLSVFTLSFIFLPILFLLKSKEAKVKREKVVLGIATVLGILMSIGTLFRVMHWPGARIIWLGSLAILFFIFLPIYFFGGIRNPETKINTIVSSVLILFAGGLLFLLTSLRSSQQIDYLYASSIEQTGKSYAFATDKNFMKYSEIENDSTKAKNNYVQLKMQCDSLCSEIEAAKNQIIDYASFGQELKPTMEMLVKDYAGNYDLPSGILFDHNGIPNEKLKTIKRDIEKLKTLLNEKFHFSVVSILNTEDVLSYGNPGAEKISWESSEFYHAPFELVMLNFNQLELNVRIVEASCL
jgi:hypothetical protein